MLVCDYLSISPMNKENIFSQLMWWCYFFCYHPKLIIVRRKLFVPCIWKGSQPSVRKPMRFVKFYSSMNHLPISQTFNELKQSLFKIKLKAHKCGWSLILEFWYLCLGFSVFSYFFFWILFLFPAPISPVILFPPLQ